MRAQAHLRTLTFLSLLSRVLIATLIIVSTSLFSQFDASPRLVLSDSTAPWISALLRWDTFYFLLIAENGYIYEHVWAFFPALPLLMRLSNHVLSYTTGLDTSPSTALLGGFLLAASLDVDTARTLYRLSLHHLRSPSAAFLSAALSLLSSSPAMVRFAPCTEPFFGWCAYRGMWACTQKRWGRAAVWFTLASAFRSNGILFGGFLVWGVIVEPWFGVGARDEFKLSRVLHCALLVALPLLPFGYHNYTGYLQFCTNDLSRPAWCGRPGFSLWPPSIYGYVQARYWNVGFLRYWTLSNVPLFVLTLPILANVGAFGVFYLSNMVKAYMYPSRRSSPSLFVALSVLPHVLLGLGLALLLTVSAHVQIALRVLPSLPVVYWGAAWLLIERPGWGKAWVAWSVVWGAVSCVLWAAFLPPA